MAESPERRKERERMVTRQIAARGVRDPRVLAAMRRVPRDLFVPASHAPDAYDDHPLPIGHDQTISQPFIVALMAEALEVAPTDRVLEVGTGSGYGAAVLAQLGAEVWTVERVDVLALAAARVLAELCAGNVHAVIGDGSLGWPEAAPYDAISVTARADGVPKALLDQLADGGRMVVPAGSEHDERLWLVRRHGRTYQRKDLGPVRFVPLIGGD